MRSRPGTFDHAEETGRSIPILLGDAIARPKTILGDGVKNVDELIPQPNREIGKIVDCRLPTNDTSQDVVLVLCQELCDVRGVLEPLVIGVPIVMSGATLPTRRVPSQNN